MENFTSESLILKLNAWIRNILIVFQKYVFEKHDEFDAIENNFGIKIHKKNDGLKC